MRVLLLGGGLQGLSCGESLKKTKHEVGVISDELQIRKSCYFQHVYDGGEKVNPQAIIDIVKKDKYDVVIPMGDKAVTFLSENKELIEKNCGCKIASPENQILKIVEDKHLFMSFCEGNRVPHPKTCILNDNQLETSAEQIGFPALIKPDYSVGARGITRVDSLNELKEKFPIIQAKFGTCTLQELIDNQEYYYNVMLYRDRNGNFPAYVISKIVRMFPVNAGSSSCLKTVVNDELLHICKDCLNKLSWVGMADFDVLQRPDNHEYKIIEINPRVPASLRAAYVSGVNFPLLIALDTLGRELPHFNYKQGKILRYLGIDIMWFLKSKRRFHTSPNWFHFYGQNIYYQDIILRDFSTWWTWLAEGLSKITKRNKRLR